jgi:hypothetical protein
MIEYNFEQLKDCIQECTGWDLIEVFDPEGELETEYQLIDPYGDKDGDPFYDLLDVYDHITNNEQVLQYLNELET